MYLFINNAGQKKMTLGFSRGRKIFWLNFSNPQSRKERILLSIDAFLKKQGKTLKALKGIVVVNGPGSFSGIRAALSVSNILSWVLNIPVVGINLAPETGDNGDLFEKGLKELLKSSFGGKKRGSAAPFYGKEPNITRPG